MPTEAVDMGWLSNRFWQLDGVTTDLPTFDAYILETFGRIRTAMNAENAGNNWNVGFFPRWQGASNRYGYGMKIERLSAGTPTGQEWWFMFAGPYTSFTDVYAEMENLFVSQTELNNYFFPVSASGGFDGGFAMHYHRGGASTTYDVGTLTADFQDPASVGGTSPDVSPTNFMPNFATNPYSRGMAHYNLAESTEYRWVWLYNHEVPFCGLYFSEDQAPWIELGFIGGDIFVPRVSTDTYIEGCVGFNFQNGSSFGFDALAITGLNHDGTSQEDYSNDNHGNFNWLNQPRSDGSWDLDPIKIYNNNLDKGYIRKDVIGIQGVSGGQMYQLFQSDQGIAVKLHNQWVFPWSTNLPIPFHGFPLNPQQVQRS